MKHEYRTYRHHQYDCEWTALRVHEDFGRTAVDLARPPRRFWSDEERAPHVALRAEAVRRLEERPRPAELLMALPGGDNWQAMTRRSLQRLFSWFLIAEDPQRRLERSLVASLAHQASIVRHVLSETDLQHVLIADEVGLGKTIEAGLMIRELVAANPAARVLYLAPARLVRNVERELNLLSLGFRTWVAGGQGDARLSDSRVIASIHRAVTAKYFEAFSQTSWDVIVVDECHHLSDYSKSGTSPLRKLKLVQELKQRMPPEGRLILLSGTPHQGHGDRFNNLLGLLRRDGEGVDSMASRVIYRTKEDVRDWEGRPLFPKRDVRSPILVDLGAAHKAWLRDIHKYFEPNADIECPETLRRAATWRCAQAMQWATSSVEAGLGYLVRQALRAGFDHELSGLDDALRVLRPYRGGSDTEPLPALLERIAKAIRPAETGAEAEVQEDLGEDEEEDEAVLMAEEGSDWAHNARQLSGLLQQGVALLNQDRDAKWETLQRQVLSHVGDEKVVLFAQPIETVTALAGYLKRRTGNQPALIMGGQTDAHRTREIEAFWREDGPQFLISSRAGGEGLNLQVARRIVHVDIPWNPMEMEQRVGRVHRFKSRRTIIVDTLVTSESREEVVYLAARTKLGAIASRLVEPDRFELVFARVMALVAPDELLKVMGREPLAPLTNEDRDKVESLVSDGYERWSSFDQQYRSHQERIRELDPGQARWEDVRRFARDHLGAQPAQGYSVLRFMHQEDEIVETPGPAEVFVIDGHEWAIGDYGGMPIVGEGGRRAESLGTNTEFVLKALRRFAFPERATGAAHVRWPEASSAPGSELPWGLVFFARQSLRDAAGDTVEIAATIHAFRVEPSQTIELPAAERASVLRTLLDATVRREPEHAPALLDRLGLEQARLFAELHTPSDQEYDEGVRHAVTPLAAVVVSR